MKETENNNLERGLQNRHIQLIALGGAIGTGLFLGIGPAAVLAGPGIIFGYAFAGIIAFFIMRQLGEMIVEEPVAGSFSHFAHKYWSPFWGFASGWNYWLLYILVSMSELTAVGIYIHFWFPEIPLWFSALFFFIIINALNFTNVKVYGETEFWFSMVKVVAIIAMIVFGTYLLISGTAGAESSVENLWNNGGVLPKSWLSKDAEGNYQGLLAAMALIMFSFGGLELVGITAAEAKNPQKTIPLATNQIIWRILIFYVGSLIILFALTPWTQITEGSSPFVMVFETLKGWEFKILGHTFYFTSFIAHVLNIIVLTAALSVYNSGVYSNSRMLYALAAQQNAPAFLLKLNKSGIPINSIIVSALFVLISVGLNKVIPQKAFEILISFVVSALLINWLMISFTHLKFKQHKKGQKTVFPSLLYPISNYIALAFLFAILGIMWITGMKLSVELIPIWLIFLYICYEIFIKNKKEIRK